MTVTFVEVTPGSGARILFDSDGGGTPQYAQIVRLGAPVLSSTTIAPGDATDGFNVQTAKIVPGTGATSIAKAQDNVVGATDTGIAMLAMRLDAPVTITPASGDYAVPRMSKRGALWTESADNIATGNLTAAAQTVEITDLQGAGTCAISLTGFGTATMQFEGSIDGTNYFAISALPTTPGPLVTSATANGTWQLGVSGFAKVRVRCSAYTSGTIVATLRAGSGINALVALDSPIPTGANVIGAVTASGTFPVTDNAGSLTVDAPVGTPVFVRLSDGSAAIATLPVSIAATVTVDTEMPAAAAMSDTISRTLSTPQVGVLNMYDDATNYVRAKGDVTGGAWVQGPAATDAAVAGKPLLSGARATTATPTEMSADGDVVPIAVDRGGVMYVRPFDVTSIVVTPTVSTTPVYTASDQIGGVMTFTGAARKNGGMGYITSASLKFATLAGLAAGNSIWLHLWHRRTTAPTITSSDNAALQITDANNVAGEFLTSILIQYDGTVGAELGSIVNFTDNYALWKRVSEPIRFKCGSSVTAIYGVLQNAAGTTLQFAGTSDLVCTIDVEQY